MNESLLSNWKWGMWASIAIMLLMLFPQISLWLQTGSSWQGSYVVLHTDEVAYSAYVNGLISGRERRSDPYTGRENSKESPQAESLFSIQFFPSYLIAIPARILGISASSTFIWLTAISSFLSTLAIFWLVKSVTGDARLAAAGAVSVLCFGAFIATYGEIRVYFGDYLGQGAGSIAVPFTRRYQPAAAFPFFLVFFSFVWHAFAAERLRNAFIYSMAAGLSFAVLVFSYFYLWTAAAAWMSCLTLLYFIFQRQQWKRNFIISFTISFFAAIAIIPYLKLLSQRAESLDSTQALTFTHLPDLFRPCELLGVLLAIIIGYQIWRGFCNIKEHLTLFALSFALLPLILFNQQLVTGLSLQLIHYELYAANYIVLIAIVLTISLIAQTQFKQKISNRILIYLAILSLGWGFIEITGLTKRSAELMKIDEGSMVVLKRLKVLSISDPANSANGKNDGFVPSVLAANVDQADILPTVAPQAVLWSPHISVFSGLKPDEGKERFYQYIYFTGTSEKELGEAIGKNQFEVMAAIFGYERALPALSNNSKPISNQEKLDEIHRFSQYGQNFAREQATKYNLSYLVTYANDEPNLSNLDRWFERDNGEQLGKYKLYRVKLRP